MEEAIYQTLDEFMKAPFGKYDNDNYHKYNTQYQKLKNEIKVENILEYKDTFMIHVKIPSESNPGKFYDVVIQFIPGDDSLKNDVGLDNYYIQFFSNSPSFIYRYAVLYKVMGFMIDAFQEKMDPKYADTLPTKTNADMKMSYDKSLFLACRYLQDYRVKYMKKGVLRAMPKVSFKQFVDSVMSYEGQKPKYDIFNLEAIFNKELIEDIQRAGKHMKLGKPSIAASSNPASPKKIIERKSTERSGVGIISKKKPISKIKSTVSTFGTSSFKKMRTSNTIKKKPKLRSTRKG